MSSTIHGGQLTLTIDSASGRWTGLHGGRTSRSWIARDSDCGLPFVAASGQNHGAVIELPTTINADRSFAKSVRGGSELHISGNEQALSATLSIPDRRGPRSGLRLDLDHLDRDEHDRDIHHGVMPVMIETAADLSWAWLAWQRTEDDLLLLAVDGTSAGWHIRYSYAGHRMLGFDVLMRADDVIAEGWSNGRLPTTTNLTIHLAQVSSRQMARERAHQLLGLAASIPNSTAAVMDSTIRLTVNGEAVDCQVIAPDGGSTRYAQPPSTVTLSQSGCWLIRTTSANGRQHESRILALDDWRTLAQRSLSYHREHYQLSCGAFARVLNAQGIPEGRTMEYTHFGNPDEVGSCRTGEFGGFGAWSQAIHQRHFGADPAMQASFAAYLDWLGNRGHEDQPRPGTMCREPQDAYGLPYSPGHFYQEINYAQHEAWLIHQLADAVTFGDMGRLDDLRLLVGHYLSDHVDANGMIWNLNFPHEEAVDYATVDCPLVHLIAAEKTLRLHDATLAQRLARLCRQQAEHLFRRGFSFPTEGEPCTEDGSIACQAWGLAHAYNELPDPDPAWIELASALMAFHAKLELSGSDIRLDGSSIRFWETQYESDDYGPSINAGHGWTLWSALARWELYRATGNFAHFARAWQHTACVASRLQRDGSFPPCWTPDPIPSLPHDDAWGDPPRRIEGRMTSAVAGLRYPSCRSMSGMHLFISAPQMWYHSCGYDPATGQLINARLENGALIPHTPLPCSEVALGSQPTSLLVITGLAETCTIISPDGQRHVCSSRDGRLRLNSDNLF